MSEKYKFIELDQNNYAYLEPNTGFWVPCNYTAYYILKSNIEGLTARVITEQLAKKFELQEDMLSEDVNNCIDSFTKKQKKHNEDLKTFQAKENREGVLTIHITDKCNLNCPYCYKDANHLKVENEITPKEIEQVIRKIYEYGFREVIISGGEPTVRKDFGEILDILRGIDNISYFLITNGTTNLEDEILQKMCDVFTTIQISLDSYEEEKNALTRGAGSLAKVEKFAKRLSNEGFKNFYFACTPYTHDMKYPSTIEDLPIMLRYANNMGGSGLYVNKLKPDGRQDKDDYSKFNEPEFWKNVDRLYDEYSAIYTRTYDKENPSGFNFSCGVASDMIDLLNSYKYKKSCGIGYNQLTIDSDGNVYLCSALIYSELKLGNIRKETLDNIILESRKKYNDITVDHIEACKECDYRLICGGGCRAMAYYEKKDLKGCDPSCEFCKDRIKKWMLLSLANNV